MKKLLLTLALLMASAPAEAIEDDLDQRYRAGRAMTYWGMGSGVIGGAVAVPMTTETMRIIRDLRRSSNPVEACANAVIAILIVPPLVVLTGAAWAGASAGTGVGLGGSLMARGALVDAGGKVTPVPGILGITSLAATPPLLIFGLENEDENLIYAGMGTFAGANAMLLTQGLLNGAEYRQLGTASRGLSLTGQPQREVFIPTITIGGRF